MKCIHCLTGQRWADNSYETRLRREIQGDGGFLKWGDMVQPSTIEPTPCNFITHIKQADGKSVALHVCPNCNTVYLDTDV